MILFYAWTDTQLINTVNVKENYYSQQQADLLVLNLSRISKELIEVIREKRIFREVYILNLPDGYMEGKRVQLKDKMKALFLGSVYWKNIKQQLKKYIGNNAYSHFFTAAFWSETLFVLRYLKKYNPNLEVWFYEDGLANYNGPKGWLFKAVPNRSVKATIRTILYYGLMPYTYRKYVKGVYLYEPRISNIDYLETKKIPSINEEQNKECFQICKEMNHSSDEVYQDSDIIYIADAPDTDSTEPFYLVYGILDSIYEIKPDAKVVLKLHPTMEALQIKFADEKYAQLHIDKRKGCIEHILMQVDLDKKIVITGNSSSALYIGYVYNKQPYMILTTNFSSNSRWQEYTQRYTKYYEQGKISVPSNFDELKKCIKEQFEKQ